MPDLSTLALATSQIIKNAPAWLNIILDTLTSKEKTIDVRQDKKSQLRHLEIDLRNALERGMAQFVTPDERDQYLNVLSTLAEPGPNSDVLSKEVLNLLVLNDNPNLNELNELYNNSLRTRKLNSSMQYEQVDAVPYLNSFFNAFIEELSNDPLFRERISDVLKTRVVIGQQRSLEEIVTTLSQITEIAAPNYTIEQLETDIKTYLNYLKKTFRYLKIVGVVPKDIGNKSGDPQLHDMFVPIDVTLQNHENSEKQNRYSVISLLEQFPCLVLLGGPGSGKSTLTRYLAWGHAVANSTPSPISLASMPLLPGKPLPLRIELRRLMEERKQYPHYSLLSYTTKLLWEELNLHIDQQMFHILLERKAMLLLLDGLDEVATFEERQNLINEIEAFVDRYPGNHILVTSRPVGYEFAQFSDRTFAHAQILAFNDKQIHTFLTRWYTHVLRLSPLPLEDKHELEGLYTTLQSNPRLRVLAENPLLLTAITALNRYERLPDKRVLIYDRCADLLLETWSKLRGTDKRWKDMKMRKEDLYACIAHLGFVLHNGTVKRAENLRNENRYNRVSSKEDLTNELPARSILREVEFFLANQYILSSSSEQHLEAVRFLDLMREEAGLIVERGTNEKGEPLYGFIHRTFQEYFAAVDVYERYLQEEISIIISDFLEEHLHDPHWHEVILLLFGKLKRKPATSQLYRILEGKSRRSKYTNIVQQDLFFACTCLSEEIVINNDLATNIVSRMGELVKHSPIPLQRIEALEALAELTHTREYTYLGQEELVSLLNERTITDIPTRIEVAKTLYFNSLSQSSQRDLAAQLIITLAQYPDIPFKEIMQAVQAVYDINPLTLREREQASQLLYILAHRSDLSVEQVAQVAQTLYRNNPPQSLEWQLATEILLTSARRSDLSVEQAVQVAQTLNENSLTLPQEKEIAMQMLVELTQQPNLSVAQTIQIAQTLYQTSPTESVEQQKAIQLLEKLTQSPEFSFAQSLQAAETLYWESNPYSEERKQAVKQLVALASHPEVSFQNIIQIAQTFYEFSFDKELNKYVKLNEQHQIVQVLKDLEQRPHISFEQQVQILGILYEFSFDEPEKQQRIAYKLLYLAQEYNISLKQAVAAIQTLYCISPIKSKEEQQVSQLIWQLALQRNLTVEERLLVLTIPLSAKKANYSARVKAIQILLNLVQEDTARDYLKEHWQLDDQTSKVESTDLPFIIDIIKNEMLPSLITNNLYKILRDAAIQLDD